MKGKILIIDDEPDILDTLEPLLTLEGFQVRKASGGRQAVEICQSERFDLAITDIHMPEMDGLEVSNKLKQLDQDIEIIVLTGFATVDNAIEALQNDKAFDFLRKPLENLDEFFNKIRQALEKRTLRIQNRRLLEELKKHRDHLEDLVVQRTAELIKANEQLRQEIAAHKQTEEDRRQLETQLRQAQKLDALDTLAGGMAHDFNNVLGMMLGYAELLLEEHSEDDREKEYLERIYRAGERGTELVRQILTFSRAQEQQQLTSTNIAPIIEETLKMLRATIPANIIIRPRIPLNCPPILADATQIHQTIVNLCVNASHAMREKGGTLDVNLEEVTYSTPQTHVSDLAAGTYLKLTVSDTGCGMLPEVQEHIFEPFFTTKESGKGTGLGLSVVHGIVKGHQGVITVESAPAKGTTFQIFFPTTDETELPKESFPETRVRKDWGSILIVDDEPDLIELYEIALKKLGYHVTTLTNSYDALKAFQANPDAFDLVFTGQAMPNMTGSQLSQELLHIRSDIPIILTTGYNDAISEKRAKELGIRQFLMKPVKIRTFIQIIRKILNEKSVKVT